MIQKSRVLKCVHTEETIRREVH